MVCAATVCVGVGVGACTRMASLPSYNQSRQGKGKLSHHQNSFQIQSIKNFIIAHYHDPCWNQWQSFYSSNKKCDHTIETLLRC